MLIGFFDDTDLVVDDEDNLPDIFVLGGYFIRQDLLALFQARISEVKRKYGLLPHAPIKWNLKDDSIRKFYRPEFWLNPDEPDRLIKIAFDIRHDLLALLAEFNAIVIVSARYDIAREEVLQSQYSLWAFENLIQRVGLMAQALETQNAEASSTMLVIDWPPTGVGKSLFDIYMGGYNFGRGLTTGQDYYSGHLRQYRFYESITHGSTLHSGPLQIADLTVGCAKDFLAWAIKGTSSTKIKGLFDMIMPCFYRAPDTGKINGFGFKVAKNDVDIDAKIAEYIAL